MLGAKLKELRNRRKLTVRDAGKLSGVSNCFISQLENGSRSPTLIVFMKLIKLYRVKKIELATILQEYLKSVENKNDNVS